jgi:hypothetical protein
VPAVTNAANHRGWYYNSRCSWCHDYRHRGRDYDWTSITEASSVRTRMKARTISIRSAGTANIRRVKAKKRLTKSSRAL